MKVYILWFNDHHGEDVISGIYSTKEKAQSIIDECPEYPDWIKLSYSIEEVLVDED